MRSGTEDAHRGPCSAFASLIIVWWLNAPTHPWRGQSHEPEKRCPFGESQQDIGLPARKGRPAKRAFSRWVLKHKPCCSFLVVVVCTDERHTWIGSAQLHSVAFWRSQGKSKEPAGTAKDTRISICLSQNAVSTRSLIDNSTPWLQRFIVQCFVEIIFLKPFVQSDWCTSSGPGYSTVTWYRHCKAGVYRLAFQNFSIAIAYSC